MLKVIRGSVASYALVAGAARGMIVDIEHPTRGRMATPASPIRLSASSTEVTRAPLLGEHNAEILGKVCGLDAEELAKLKAEGVI